MNLLEASLTMKAPCVLGVSEATYPVVSRHMRDLVEGVADSTSRTIERVGTVEPSYLPWPWMPSWLVDARDVGCWPEH